jgi:hypothetical protein
MLGMVRGEHEAGVEPGERIREIATHIHRKCIKLSATSRDDDDHMRASHK